MHELPMSKCFDEKTKVQPTGEWIELTTWKTEVCHHSESPFFSGTAIEDVHDLRWQLCCGGSWYTFEPRVQHPHPQLQQGENCTSVFSWCSSASLFVPVVLCHLNTAPSESSSFVHVPKTVSRVVDGQLWKAVSFGCPRWEGHPTHRQVRDSILRHEIGCHYPAQALEGTYGLGLSVRCVQQCFLERWQRQSSIRSKKVVLAVWLLLLNDIFEWYRFDEG